MSDFTRAFQATVRRFDDLPAGKKADYERSRLWHERRERQHEIDVAKAGDAIGGFDPDHRSDLLKRE